MSCRPNINNLDPIQYNCNLAFGGLKSVQFEGHGADFTIEFNNKDAYTNYTEVKTASPDGASSCVQTLSIEVPIFQNVAEKIMKFANPKMKFNVTILTKSGKTIVMGMAYGASLSTATGTTGASRTEKNMTQLVFTAEESNLSNII